MKTLRIVLSIALALVFGLSEIALAGAPGSGGRIENLEAFCSGGSSHGLACGGPGDCPSGSCQIRRDGSRKRPFLMIATLIIDDDTDAWEGEESGEGIHSVSILLEFVARGRRRLLAQNYVNISGEDAAALIASMKQGVEIADLPNSDRRLDEALGAAAVRDKGIIDDFLFQRADSRIEDELRHYFRTTGDFVVTRTRGLRGFSNQEDNSLATVIQARLDVVVTPEAD